MQRTLAPRDLARVRNLIDAQISPDGQSVIYAVSDSDLEADQLQTSLWLLHLDQPEKEALRLTGHPTDSSARFAPDSERVAFVSRRGDRAQLYTISINGGEAKQHQTEFAPTSTPLWSHDGQSIAFKALVDRAPDPRYPGEPEELFARPAEHSTTKAGKKQPGQVHVITDINYHADGTGMIQEQFNQLFLLNLQDGHCRQLTSGEDRIGDFIWSQDGNALLYLVKNYDAAETKYTSTVRQIEVGNQNNRVLLDFDGSLNRIDLSPNGRWLLLSGTDNSCPQGMGNAMIWAIDLCAGDWPLDFRQAICLTAGQGTNCEEAQWDQTGDNVFFVRYWHGATEFHRVPFTGEAGPTSVRLPVTYLATLTHYDLAKNGAMIFIANDFVHPPELYLQSQTGPKQLTRLNQPLLEEFTLCPAERFTYKGADNWDIDGWLVKPLGYQPGRRYPAVLSVHGGPTGAYYDSFQFPFQLLAHQGFAVVFTNPRGSVTYGSDFAQGCINDLGGKDYQDISAGLDQAIAMGVVDKNRIGVTGWSYGGFMTCWMVTQTNRFRAAVGGANISNWYTLYGCSDTHVYSEGLWGGPAFDEESKLMQHSPIRYVRNVETPIMLLHGESDIRCPIGQSEQFYTALRRLGKTAVFVRYPGQFHGVKQPSYIVDRWLRTVAWFKQYLLND